MIAEIKARLLEAGTPFSIVEGANQLAQVEKRPPATPAAYVFISGEKSGANQRATSGILQKQAIALSVMLISENLGAAEDSQRDIEALKDFVRAKLLGFEVPDFTPLEHIEGELVQAKDGTVWFEDVYGSTRYLEQTDE